METIKDSRTFKADNGDIIIEVDTIGSTWAARFRAADGFKTSAWSATRGFMRNARTIDPINVPSEVDRAIWNAVWECPELEDC